MKFFFSILLISVLWIMYGLSINSINMICAFGFIAVSSSILLTAIWVEDLIKEIYIKVTKDVK